MARAQALRVEYRQASLTTPALEIRYSAKRRRTATAWWEGATLVVALPARMLVVDREPTIQWLIEKSSKHRPALHKGDQGLLERAHDLSGRYDLGVEPRSVRFVSNQKKRWGSCTPLTGEIRLSDRLKLVPAWVLDAVLVHELAHLAVDDHSAAFHSLANRFERQDEATIFLEGFQLGLTAHDTQA